MDAISDPGDVLGGRWEGMEDSPLACSTAGTTPDGQTQELKPHSVGPGCHRGLLGRGDVMKAEPHQTYSGQHSVVFRGGVFSMP